MPPNEKAAKLDILLLSSITILLVLLFWSKGVPWDTAVYVGMGKYLFSFGTAGFWEAARPPVLPILLGAAWRLGDPVIAGRTIALLSSIGCVIFTYLIGKRLLGRREGIIAALLLSTTHVFIQYASVPLTDILSAFFGLIALYLFLENQHWAAGMVLGVSFLTRFYQGIIFGVLAIILFTRKKGCSQVIIGFFALVIPYLIINLFVYKNLFYPFLLQFELVRSTDPYWAMPWWFYFKELFYQSYISLLLIPALFMKKARKSLYLPFILFFVFLIFFSFAAHKEDRFMLLFIPYRSLIIAAVIGLGMESANAISPRLTQTLIVFLIILLFLPVLRASTLSYKEPPVIQPAKGELWTSNPYYVLASDQKAVLLYYPFVTAERLDKRISDLANPVTIIINSCDLICKDDGLLCRSKVDAFISSVSARNPPTFDETDGRCRMIVSEKK